MSNTKSLIEGSPTIPGEGASWTLRPYQSGDARIIAALWTEAFASDGLNIVVTEKERLEDFGRPGFDPARQVIVAERRVEGLPYATTLGFGQLNIRDDEEMSERIYEVLVIARPHLCPLGLERDLFGTLIRLAHEHNSGAEKSMPKAFVKANFSDKQSSQRELYTQAGMREERQFWTMECPLDRLEEPPHIEGITMRDYCVPDDNSRTLKAFNDSFSDHFDFHPSTPERWEYRMNSPFVRPDLTVLAEVDADPDEIGGFCICGVFEEENKATGRNEGWIELLGTTRAWRRKGLGRAVLLSGMHNLRSAGYSMVALGVDSMSPTGANRLYESVGFRIRDLWLLYQCTLDEVKLLGS
ncbi:MAG: GNAT family N-acetyltransferase [Chloroflexota bacterium]|nr:GNAT family N-acetyltransferase [Chloroflexota bacterium]